MAERVPAALAARLAAALDSAEVVMARDGVASRHPARLGVVALDEGSSPDESPPAALLDRLALHLDLHGLAVRDTSSAPPYTAAAVGTARLRLGAVECSDAMLEATCGAAMALGIDSLRAPHLALQVARAAAALAARQTVSEDDLRIAARLVLAPRATVLPAPEPDPASATAADPANPAEQPPPPDQASMESDTPPPPQQQDAATTETDETPETRDGHDQALAESVLAAATASIPAGLLARIRLAGGYLGSARSAGHAGALQQGARRGRPAGIRRGEPRAGARLDVLGTLRAAAPWQRLRQPGPDGAATPGRARIQVRREDFHVARYKQRAETTTIFAVDASGSAALHRLAEAKGAVELLLADCYVRRDRVAVIAFRGTRAEVLLPPTRSLVRAKRSLAGLPGGGGTPLAAGIDLAVALAQTVARQGGTPLLVLLTDGRANVSRAGTGGRAVAEQEALFAARQLRMAALSALLVDTSPQAQPAAQRLAAEMHAAYLPLPYAGAAELSAAVRSRSAPPH
jgi:magnesium chelatase subunit D